MTITLAFWSRNGQPDDDARAFVVGQAQAWADAEPAWDFAGVVAGPTRPYPDRSCWWEVCVRLTPRVDQPTLGLSA